MKPCSRFCPMVRDCDACIWRGGEPKQPDPDPDDTEGE